MVRLMIDPTGAVVGGGGWLWRQNGDSKTEREKRTDN